MRALNFCGPGRAGTERKNLSCGPGRAGRAIKNAGRAGLQTRFLGPFNISTVYRICIIMCRISELWLRTSQKCCSVTKMCISQATKLSFTLQDGKLCGMNVFYSNPSLCNDQLLEMDKKTS